MKLLIKNQKVVENILLKADKNKEYYIDEINILVNSCNILLLNIIKS
jgi:hypothetical protein